MNTQRRRFWISVLVALVLLTAAVTGTYLHTENRLLEEQRTSGEARLALYSELLHGWLAKYRALPSIYAHEPDVIALLQNPDSADRIATLNERFAYWNESSGASATYLIDKHGTTVAASNWDSDGSFVGNYYAFRPYFQEAMQGRLGRTFALGTVSGMRGYYFAYPVMDSSGIIGVMVVKAGVDAIEQELRLDTSAVFVTDKDGVVVLAGPPDWRMTTLQPLSETALQEIEKERRFPANTLKPLPVEGLESGEGGVVVTARPDRSDREVRTFVHLSRPLRTENWRIHLLVGTEGVTRESMIAALLTALAMFTVLLAGLLLWQRRRRMMDLLATREEARKDLERLVSERTANLRAANVRLEEEVYERAQAEADLRQAQSELIQAGKLAGLGQMSAALSHEFNQPLAAIRTYSDNAMAFLDRGKQDQASENLARISRLTERVARLSKHLTSFARKPKDTVEPVPLDAVMSETLALLQARIERAGVQPKDRIARDLMVLGGQTRLQHVFMNLIGNALDATADTDDPVIILRTEETQDAVRIIVEDNGPGVAPEMLGSIFDPFVSTKEPGKGLGLGLSISFNIVRDFDGHLQVENRAEGGARFIVTLRQAEPMREAAE